MKTLLIGLFGLALFASDAAAQSREPNYPQTPFPQKPAVCAITGGVIVVVVQATGNVAAFACDIVAGKSIENKTQLPPGLTLDVHGPLGTISKYKSSTDPDPCIVWAVSGTSYFYCW